MSEKVELSEAMLTKLSDPYLTLDDFLKEINSTYQSGRPVCLNRSEMISYDRVWLNCIYLHPISPKLVPLFIQKVIECFKDDAFLKAFNLSTPTSSPGVAPGATVKRKITIVEEGNYITNLLRFVHGGHPRYSFVTFEKLITWCEALEPEIFDGECRFEVYKTFGQILEGLKSNDTYLLPTGAIIERSMMGRDAISLESNLLPDTFWIARKECIKNDANYDAIFTAEVLVLLFQLGLRSHQLSNTQKNKIDEYRRSLQSMVVEVFKGCRDLASLVVDYAIGPIDLK